MINKRPSFLETYGVGNVDGDTVAFKELTGKEAVELSKQFKKYFEESSSFYNRVFKELLNGKA